MFESRFARQLRYIAKLLRRAKKYPVYARLNREERRVELRRFFGFGAMVARVSVHGSEGMPHKAVVTSSVPFDTSAKLIFERELPLVVEFRTESKS